MSNLPLEVRKDLGNEWDLRPMELVRVQGSQDTTQKFLLKLRDGQLIESVLIPATQGTKGIRASRLTLCVSTQVGCGLGCKFCASGLDGGCFGRFSGGGGRLGLRASSPGLPFPFPLASPTPLKR